MTGRLENVLAARRNGGVAVKVIAVNHGARASQDGDLASFGSKKSLSMSALVHAGSCPEIRTLSVWPM
jgi:hypothetical protein